MNKPKILLLDIETAPILASVWGLFDQNVGLNQIEKDWHLLSFSAKWLDSDKIIYKDQRGKKKIENDKDLLKAIWKLLDECDILVTQNGDKFDRKKINARFVLHGMKPPSSYKSIDTLKLAKKHFGFTSNKLEYLSKNLNIKYKKQDHKKFPGFELWKECLADNIEAWKEMELYNKHDVLALEEVYKKLIPWDNRVNMNVYHSGTELVCSCGSHDFISNGHAYTSMGKFKRYKCKKCGSEFRDRENLLDPDKRKMMKIGTVR